MNPSYTMKFRTAEIHDAPHIATLHAENWKSAYRNNFRDEFLDSDVLTDRLKVWDERLKTPPPDQFVCVATDSQEIKGFICVYGDKDPIWGSFIDNLHVSLTDQHNGVGRKLMKEAGKWLSITFPVKPIFLYVWKSNPAIAFYERLGGTNAGLVEIENPGGGSGQYFRYTWNHPDVFNKI